MHTWLTSAIGKTIHERRVEKQLRLKPLSELTSIPIASLMRIERGVEDLDVNSLEQLAAALEVSPEWIITNAAGRDWERVLVVGACNTIADLEANCRQILHVSTAAQATGILHSGRVDCLVVDANYAPEVRHLCELGWRHNPHCQVIVLLKADDQQLDLPSDVASCMPARLSDTMEDLLAKTRRGQFARLRRRVAAIAATRARLVDQHDKLLWRRKKLVLLWQRLSKEHRQMLSRQIQLAARARTNGVRDEVQQKLELELERRSKVLRERHDKFVALERRVEDCSARFLERRRFTEQRQAATQRARLVADFDVGAI